MNYTSRDLIIAIRNGLSAEEAVRYLRSQGSMPWDLQPGFAYMSHVDLLDFDKPYQQTALEAKLLEVFWQFYGTTKFLQEMGTLPCSMFEGFLDEKLDSSEDAFDVDDLRRVGRICPNLRVKSNTLVSKKFTRHIKTIEWQPPQFDNDIEQVSEFVRAYGFPDDLADCLQQVERGLDETASGFDYKSALSHLRTFFEHLHKHVSLLLQKSDAMTQDKTDLTKCGQAIDYLERKGLITDKMRSLGRALYAFQSEEGTHSLISTREHVRLCRNMVAEYALVLFAELQKRLQK